MKHPTPNFADGDGSQMIFVEGFRLLFVMAGSVAGFEIGRNVDASPHAPVIGLVLGAAISYVLGGVAGRLTDKGLQQAVFLFRKTPPERSLPPRSSRPPACSSGSLSACPSWLSSGPDSRSWSPRSHRGCWPPSAGGSASSRADRSLPPQASQQILAPQLKPHPGHALLVDSSAIMDRFLLVLGRSGLLPGGLVIPQFVVDHVRSVAEAPDPVSSRRALPRARVGRGASGIGRTCPRRSRRGPRGRRPDDQTADGGPTGRPADRDLLDQCRRRGGPVGAGRRGSPRGSHRAVP